MSPPGKLSQEAGNVCLTHTITINITGQELRAQGDKMMENYSFSLVMCNQIWNYDK